jgi:hypothetical protein
MKRVSRSSDVRASRAGALGAAASTSLNRLTWDAERE